MAEAPIILSVLDRLIGADLDDRGFRLRGREHSVAQHRASVQRDLEWLLNTRRTPDEAPEDLPETRDSVYHYGIPDVSSLGEVSVAVQTKLGREIRESIRRFEPRLSQVRVVWLKPEDQEDGEASPHELRFRIEAVLMMDPEPERVTFDAVLDRVQGDFEVQGGRNAR